MKIAIGSDKSGFTAKEAIKAYFNDAGIEYDDLGTTNVDEPKPYYEVANIIAAEVQKGTYEKAIIFCGTGAVIGVGGSLIAIRKFLQV